MRGPAAFDHIHDEHDPAWHGHALVEPESRWRGAMPWCIVGALVVAACVLAAFVWPRGDERAQPRAAAAGGSASGAQLPVVGAAESPASQALPTVESADPQPTGDVMLSSAGGSTGSSEPKHDLWAGAPRSYISPASPVARPGSKLSGDLIGLAPSLTAALEQLATALGKPLEIVSGHRTHAEQVDLYRRFTSGTGNLAAVPGTSRHERGDAADVYVDGVALADVPGAALLAKLIGLGFPVPGEPWHVEVVSPS